MDKILELFNTLSYLFKNQLNNLIFRISATIVTIGYFGNYAFNKNIWDILIYIGLFVMMLNLIWWRKK